MRKLTLSLFAASTALFSFGQKMLQPKSSIEILIKGFQEMEKENYDEAEAQFKLISVNDTNYVVAQKELAITYMASDRHQEAVDILEDLLIYQSKFKDRANVYTLLGQAYDGLEQYDKSLATYNKGIEEYPKNHLLYYSKAGSLEKQEKYQEALENYKLSAQANMNHHSSHLQLGLYAAREGHFAEAMLSFMTCLLTEPNGDKSSSIVSFLEEMADGSYTPEKRNVNLSYKGDDFEDLNLLIINKIALQSKYKVKLSIPTAYARQLHLILSTVDYNKNDEGYWHQMYLPMYTQIFDAGLLDAMSVYSLQSIQNPNIQKKVAAKKSLVEKFLKEGTSMWSDNILNQYMEFEGSKKHVIVVYQKAGLIVGQMNDSQQMIGNWYYYYPQGNVRLKVQMNNSGKKHGIYQVWDEFTRNMIEEEEYDNDMLTGTQKFFYASGELSQTRTYKNGEMVDTVFNYYRGGQISSKIPVNENGRHGLTTTYYQNGTLKSEVMYVDGLADGKYVTYHRNGQKEMEMMLEKDILNGTKKAWYPNGQLQYEYTYKNDTQDGPYETYHVNGNLEEEGTMLAGKYNGTTTEYYSNGVLFSKGEYDEDGKENGTLTNHDSEGKKYIAFSFKKGNLEKVEIFDKDEKVVKTIEKSGKKIAFENYYPTRTLSMEGDMVSGKRDGLWKYYDNYGTLSKTEKYVNGVLQDSVIGYHPNGKIRFISEQKDGQNHGYYLEYSTFGVLTQEGRYNEGEPVNDWYEYYSDGTLREEYAFKNGDQHGYQRNYAVNGKMTSYDIYSEGSIVGTIYLDTNGNEIKRFGQFDGEIRITDPSGSYDRFVGNYESGFIDGETKWYDAEKNLITKGTNINGKREGVWYWYDDKGNVTKKINYQDGEVHGELTEYYPDGKVRSLGKYEYGDMQGTTVWYYENGKKESEINYLDDQRHGKMTTYGYDGSIQQFRYYDRGVLLSYSHLDKAGKEVAQIPVEKGETSFTVYYQNGKKAIEQTRVNGLIHGVYKEYYADGKVMTEGNYYYDDRNGSYKTYHPNGKLKTEGTYMNDYIDGEEKEYFASGNLKETVVYKNGVRHGETKTYSEDGKLIKTTLYYDGEMVWVK